MNKKNDVKQNQKKKKKKPLTTSTEQKPVQKNLKIIDLN